MLNLTQCDMSCANIVTRHYMYSIILINNYTLPIHTCNSQYLLPFPRHWSCWYLLWCLGSSWSIYMWSLAGKCTSLSTAILRWDVRMYVKVPAAPFSFSSFRLFHVGSYYNMYMHRDSCAKLKLRGPVQSTGRFKNSYYFMIIACFLWKWCGFGSQRRCTATYTAVTKLT